MGTASSVAAESQFPTGTDRKARTKGDINFSETEKILSELNDLDVVLIRSKIQLHCMHLDYQVFP